MYCSDLFNRGGKIKEGDTLMIECWSFKETVESKASCQYKWTTELHSQVDTNSLINLPPNINLSTLWRSVCTQRMFDVEDSPNYRGSGWDGVVGGGEGVTYTIWHSLTGKQYYYDCCHVGIAVTELGKLVNEGVEPSQKTIKSTVLRDIGVNGVVFSGRQVNVRETADPIITHSSWLSQ